MNMGPRMVEIMHLIHKGKSLQEVAKKLGISYSTVAVHLCRVYRLCKVKDVEELRITDMRELERRIAVNLIARKLVAWKGSPGLVKRMMPYVLEELK